MCLGVIALKPKKRMQKLGSGSIVRISTKKLYVMEDAVCDPLVILRQLLKT